MCLDINLKQASVKFNVGVLERNVEHRLRGIVKVQGLEETGLNWETWNVGWILIVLGNLI